MYVCLCKGITDSQIKEAVNNGAQSVRAIRKTLGASSQCGKCACHVRDVIQEALEESYSPALFYSIA